MKKRKPSERKTAEYHFKIEAYSPETMPLDRLAAYLTELALILGESKSVHLVRIDSGSTELVHAIEKEAVPKILDRADAVRRGDAPRDAQEAFRKVNRYLREDDARAVFRYRAHGKRILEFPGVDEAEEPYPTVKQYGSITATIIRVGGTGDKIPVLVESEGEPLAGCHANRALAKELAARLFETVRLHGQGYWLRDKEGQWRLNHYRIDSFDKLDDTSLSSVLAELRTRTDNLGGLTYDDLTDTRHG